MAATTNLMSWESFEKLPDDAMHRELIEGELQELPPPKSTHTLIALRIYDALRAAQTGRGRALTEAGFKLYVDPVSWIQPDVSFLRFERLNDKDASDYFLGAPDLAVEVVSPSERADDLHRKVQLMLRGGAVAVWVVYPSQREVEVHLPDGSSQRKTEADTLSAPELLPAWEFPVRKLFED